jgi:hypothetical protein
MPIDKFLEYIDTESEKSQSVDIDQDQFKQEIQFDGLNSEIMGTRDTNKIGGNYSTSAFDEMKQQLVPLPYTVTTSNNKVPVGKFDARKFSESSSSGVEFSIKV